MQKIIGLVFVFLALGCASQKTHETKTTDVVLNPTHGIEDCKYLGIVDVEASDDWKNGIRSRAAELGATAVTAKEPARIDERVAKDRVLGNAYYCENLLKR